MLSSIFSFSWVAIIIFAFPLILRFEHGAAVSVEQQRNVERLLETLTSPANNYSRRVIPASTCKGNTTSCPFIVQARVFIIRIQDVIENQESLATTVRFQLGWIDPALKWNPTEYSNVTSVTFPGGSLWIPDLQLANSVDEMYSLLSSEEFAFRLTNDGMVWWHVTGKIVTRCTLDLTYYPFDYQRCPIVIESSIYTTPEMQVIVRPDKPDPVSLGMYAENERWRLVDSSAFALIYKSGSTPLSRVHFWLTLKRDSSFYQTTFLIPIAMLSAIQVMTYLIPMHFCDRVSQATVVLMTSVFLEGYVADRLPKSSQQSLVQTYLNILVGVSVASIGISVITVGLLKPGGGFEYWGIPLIIRLCRCRKSLHTNGSVNSDGGNGASNLTKTIKISRGPAMTAVLLNLFGLITCLSIVVIYPTYAFLGYVEEGPPPMPRPPPDNISHSYYAEFH